MWRWLSMAVLLGLSGMLSGCGFVLVALWDATTPDRIQAVDIVQARRPDLCASLIHREGREASLIQGRIHAPGYEPEAIPLLWGSARRYSNRHDSDIDLSQAPRTELEGAVFVYVTEFVANEAVAFLSPMPLASEFEPEDGAMSLAWRSVLFRAGADGALSRECVFITRSMASYIAF